MHLVPVNWLDWINSSTFKSNICFKSALGRSVSFLRELTYDLVSIAEKIVSKIRKRRRKCYLPFLLTLVLNIVQLSVVTCGSASSTESVYLEKLNKTQIDSLPFGRTNKLIKKNGSHLSNQFYRTIRSIKLANHRLKHRRSSTNAEQVYQSNTSGGNHLAKSNYWSVLGDQEAEYALKVLESEHLTAAILHFIEITYKYAQINLPALDQQNELTDPNITISAENTKKQVNRYYNTGSCVQVKLESLRGILKRESFAKYSKQAETAKRTASLLTTLLSERLELTSDRNYIKNHLLNHGNDTSNLVLHKAFFWSLLKVNLQSDANLFANGIIFRPDIYQFPIKLFFNTIQSKDENSREMNNSTNKPFSPYIFRRKNATSHSTSSQANHSLYNYINLSGISSFTPRIVPNPNLKVSVDDVRGSMEEKIANLAQLKQTLYNKKHLDPYSNTYSYSSDWYQHYANKYLNTSLQYNYHELMKHHYSNDSLDPGYWTVPYSDCTVATGTNWLLSYSVPFFGLSKSTNQIEFKGVVLISIDLSEEDINQCSADDPFFANSHKCDRETTDCIPIKGLGFRRGAYYCQCKPSFYIPNVTFSSASTNNQTSSSFNGPVRHFFKGTAVESAFIDTFVNPSSRLFPNHFQCAACPKDCTECDSTKSCKVSYTGLLRVSVLGVQSFCATIVLILAGTTFRLRRSKNFSSSRWIILETLLFGSLLLHITVIIQYFEPKPLNCFIEPWFREFGFGFLYGSIVIKLYRIYAEFQTRKAHRVCVRDKDLLKYLLAIILVITGYMSAWSALILETINGFSNLTSTQSAAELYIIQIGHTVDNLKYYLCKQLSWDYVTQLAPHYRCAMHIVYQYATISKQDYLIFLTMMKQYKYLGTSITLIGLMSHFVTNGSSSSIFTYKPNSPIYLRAILLRCELSFILSGIYLSYCIRNARSEFYREKWALCTCIYIEFIVSGSFYLLKYLLTRMNSLHPDLIYLMHFIRCQFTVSVVLALIFGPKIFCQNRPVTNTRKSRFFTGNEQVKDRVPEAMKLHAAILSNGGDIDVSEVNLSQMDPEDIRSELRRVYTQLQILKNKTIRKDNPHISKRRGGRKTHRRFSLQAFNAHNKHAHKSSHHHHDHEQEITEVSRTPEESTASLEGPSQVYVDGQSSVLSSK